MIQLIDCGTSIVLVPRQLCACTGVVHAVDNAANVSKCS